MVLAFGVGRLALVLTAPATIVGEPAAGTAETRASLQSETPDSASWPALFGMPAPDAPERNVAVIRDYRLRGLVAEPSGGWALIGDADGDRLVRPGDQLAGGETVAEIRSDGVLLSGPQGAQLIAFSADETAPTQPPRTAEPATAPPASGAEEQRNVPLASLRDQDFRSAVARAGGLDRVERPDGTGALRILWVRNGQLYDKIGLRQGDVVLAVNGQSTAEPDTIMANLGNLLQQREFALDILRNERPLTLRLTVTE